MKQYRIVITPGEPAGIGPDLVIQLAQRSWPVELVVCADALLLQNRAALLDLPLKLLPYKTLYQPTPQLKETLTLLPLSLRVPAIPGHLHTENSYYVIETLMRACNGCLNGEFAALVTGPVHKGVINKAGIPFVGHTEFFEEQSRSYSNTKTVMMLITDKMRIALVTTHLPIRSVPGALTQELLRKVINTLYCELYEKLGISRPRILVCGLNPHAGENGYIGTEEIDIIIPVIKEMQAKGIDIIGPLPADTIFQSKNLYFADVVLAMYHDQGLPVMKYHGFNYSVNVTLGLPFIRTSVDHGTALDLAGKGTASANSFIMAINLAIEIILNANEK